MTEGVTIRLIRKDTPGGQHVGTGIYDLEARHEERGVVVVVPVCRSQHKARTIALEMIDWYLASER